MFLKKPQMFVMFKETAEREREQRNQGVLRPPSSVSLLTSWIWSSWPRFHRVVVKTLNCELVFLHWHHTELLKTHVVHLSAAITGSSKHTGLLVAPERNPLLRDSIQPDAVTMETWINPVWATWLLYEMCVEFRRMNLILWWRSQAGSQDQDSATVLH